MNAAGQNTRVGNLSLLQGIFPTQGSNPGPKDTEDIKKKNQIKFLETKYTMCELKNTGDGANHWLDNVKNNISASLH